MRPRTETGDGEGDGNGALTAATPGTYVLLATVRARTGRAEQVWSQLSELAALSQAELGCRDYRVHRDADDPLTFVLYEEWRDHAAWRRHDVRGPVVDLLTALAPQLAQPIEVQHLLAT